MLLWVDAGDAIDDGRPMCEASRWHPGIVVGPSRRNVGPERTQFSARTIMRVYEQVSDKTGMARGRSPSGKLRIWFFSH